MKQITSKNTLLLNTAGSPIAADVITTANDVVVIPKVDSKEFKDAGAGAGSTSTYNNPDLTVADFNVDVTARAAAASGSVPAYASLLKICGMKETINVGVSVVYTPELAGTLGTAKAYIDGEMREINGMVGSFNISGKIGELAQLSFSLKGFTSIVPTAEENPAVTLDSNEKLLVKQATVITEGGTPLDLTEFDLDAGMEVEQVYGVDSLEYYVKDFKPTIKIKAIKTKGNTTHWSDLKNNTIKEVIILLGDTAGKQLEIKASKCNPSNVSEADSSGVMVYEKTHICQYTNGGDNFSLTYK